MAKRRNAKKEKAARNKINARKFRKPTSRYSNRGRRNYNYNNNENTESKTSDNNSDQPESSKSQDKVVNQN